jgi:Na+/H+ antiporter NhaB
MLWFWVNWILAFTLGLAIGLGRSPDYFHLSVMMFYVIAPIVILVSAVIWWKKLSPNVQDKGRENGQ